MLCPSLPRLSGRLSGNRVDKGLQPYLLKKSLAPETQGSFIYVAIILDEALAATGCRALDYGNEVLNVAPAGDWRVYLSLQLCRRSLVARHPNAANPSP